MKSLSAIATLDMQTIAQKAVQIGTTQFMQRDEAELLALPTRFSVQVGKKQTRVFLECHAQALGTSIAALAGLILDQVVQASLEQHPSDVTD